MKTICFDIASSYFHPPYVPYLNNPEQAREEFRNKVFTFHGATAFIHETDECIDFLCPEDLFSFLTDADEIVTFNGRTCDLIVLESLNGEAAFRAIWSKPHHDLKGWRAQSLKQSVYDHVPEIRDSYDHGYFDERYDALDLRDPSNRIDVEFLQHQLAGTYRDAKCTLELFRLYLRSGDNSHTFHDQRLIGIRGT